MKAVRDLLDFSEICTDINYSLCNTTLKWKGEMTVILFLECITYN